MALDPKLKIIAPWKDQRFIDDGLTSRETAIDYARQHDIPIEQTAEKIYSRDRNLWHISHEGAEIEDPASEPDWENCLAISVSVEQAPDRPRTVEIRFESGNPVAIDGEQMPGEELIATLNEIGGEHAVGQSLLVENRLVGMKSRGVYETPGGSILYEAAKALEQITLERDLYHHKRQLAQRYAEIVYYGQWFHPLREAMQAFIDKSSEPVTGAVTVKLYKGRALAVRAQSPNALYDPKLASFAMDDYDITAARGFIDLFGLPMKVHGMRQSAET
jgi:argininosuccinate synthase